MHGSTARSIAEMLRPIIGKNRALFGREIPLFCLFVMRKVSNIDHMHDIVAEKPSNSQLFQLASEQHGYFTTAQARASGFRSNLLVHHVRTGRFLHVAPGIYRIRHYPASPYEEIVSAWLAVSKETAVVSHESALDLLDLSNAIPDAIHLTVLRTRRYRLGPPGVVIHTTTRPLQSSDIITRHGIRATTPLRSILDAATLGTAPEQIELAIDQALRRSLFDREQLLAATTERNGRVQRLVHGALELVTT